MLPGLRILFAFTLLSVSVVIFGLGAAAFLRSAHEDVANAPWRPIETPATARVDLAPPTLAMLRVEPETTTAVPAPRAEAPPLKAAPAETEIRITLVPAPAAETAEPAPTVKSPEPASAPAPAAPPPPQATAAPAAEAAGEATPAPAAVEPKVIEAKAVEAKAADAKANERTPADSKASEASTPQPAPMVIAALSIDKTEQPQQKSAAEPVSAPTAAALPPEPASATVPVEAPAGTDTLKADDKAIQAAEPAKVAALGEAALDPSEPLPSKDVRIPNPRVDPAVIEARRKQLLAQRVRAIRAQRIAAARARNAAQARAAAAAANPFGAPANSTTNNSTPNNNARTNW